MYALNDSILNEMSVASIFLQENHEKSLFQYL